MTTKVTTAFASTILAWLKRWKRRKKVQQPSKGQATSNTLSPDKQNEGKGSEKGGSIDKSDELLQRICQLMEKEQLFKNNQLRLSDVANMLGTNTTYISDCINTKRGCSFNQFVNGYRIAYVKEQMRKDPYVKLSTLYLEAGFSSETSFYRVFKSLTGITPKEWLMRDRRCAK